LDDVLYPINKICVGCSDISYGINNDLISIQNIITKVDMIESISCMKDENVQYCPISVDSIDNLSHTKTEYMEIMNKTLNIDIIL